MRLAVEEFAFIFMYPLTLQRLSQSTTFFSSSFHSFELRLHKASSKDSVLLHLITDQNDVYFLFLHYSFSVSISLPLPLFFSKLII
jgi:hypothetical protein